MAITKKPKYNIGDKVYYLHNYTKIYSLTISSIQWFDYSKKWNYGFLEEVFTKYEEEISEDYKEVIDNKIKDLLILFIETYEMEKKNKK